MTQVQIIQNANDIRVNKWLKDNADKNIIDILESSLGIQFTI